MKKAFTLTIFLTFAINLFAQLDTIIRYQLQDSTSSNSASLILSDSESDLLYFTHESDSIYISRSIDSGVNWINKRSIFPASPIENNDLAGIITEHGKIIIVYRKENSLSHYFRSSIDDGETWSEPVTATPAGCSNPSLKYTPDGRIWFLHTQTGHLKYRTSSNNGESWGVPKTLWQTANGGDIISLNDSTILLVGALRQGEIEDFDILGKLSYDNGLSWEEPFEIVLSELHDIRPKLVRKSDGEIELVFLTYKPNSNYPDHYSKILTVKSIDEGLTWSEPSYFTSFSGYNDDQNISLVNDNTYITFSSERFNNRQIWYGISDISEDLITPPVVHSQGTYPLRPLSEEPVTFWTQIIDEKGIDEVVLFHSVNNLDQEPLQMYDDGLHNDEYENDGIFGFITEGYLASDTVIYYISATDINSYTTISNPDTIIYPPSIKLATGLIDVNNILLPIANNGNIADADVPFMNTTFKRSGWFDGHIFLYAAGFGLSGYTNGSLWGNGMMTASRIEDYIPGYVDAQDDTSDFNLYLLKSTTAPFSGSWMDWKKAVELGADYYDGNNDGVYNPVDLNGNGDWDINEDAPDLLGDLTAWCVYNDGIPANSREFENVHPQGIEIRQSVFAYNKDDYPDLANVVFIRYRLENSGEYAHVMDSVYFSAWADADMGDAYDDKVGCDTTLASGYLYNDGEDGEYGVNPPAFFITLLEGPASYILGTSYVDNNSNGLFDDGIDSPLDTAIISRGELLGKEELPGATNQYMKTHVEYLKSHPTQGDPRTEEELHNYMLGKNRAGEYVNPCTWEFGTVNNEDCNLINPVHWYSGDPVSGNGWISNFSSDKRFTVSTGPFQLEVDKPIEILLAYIVGRGTDPLNSITVGKEIVKDVIRFYETNFSDYSVGIKNNRQAHAPTEFRLSQNYPNPFNAQTTIEYSIPEAVNGEGSMVKMIIYDVLGKEVATVVDKPQSPGNYKVQFNASGLASGVYFYRLEYGLYNQSKKMILMK